MSGLITSFPEKTLRTSMSCLDSAAGIIPPPLPDGTPWMDGVAGPAAERRLILLWAGSPCCLVRLWLIGDMKP